MKLFQQLLVAPAALGLLAPMAANAADLNIEGMTEYSAPSEQVTSITQFSDVYPTDWAYQALSNLIERYGCVAGYPNGTYRGNRAMTRYEAAALLNACLDRISEVTDELRRLIKEFERELAIIRGRVDGLEARVGELESTQFSTTTKLSGQTTFVIGANSFGGNAKQGAVDVDYSKLKTPFKSGWTGTQAWTPFRGRKVGESKKNYDKAEARYFKNFRNTKRADAAAAMSGATVFNYDQRIVLDTSFTGKDLLRTRLRAGNFGDSPFGAGGYVGLDGMEVGFEEPAGSNVVGIDRLFYQFPVGDSFTISAGGRVRQDDMLAVWPSAYPADTVLDFFTYAGAPGTYNLALGAGGGFSWASGGWSLSANYVSTNGEEGNPNHGGIATNGAGSNGTAQLAFVDEQWGLAAAYNYSSGGNGAGLYRGNGTPMAVMLAGEGNSSSVGLSAWWTPEDSGWVPSFSIGWGYNNISEKNSVVLKSATSQSWYVGLQWADAFLEGNTFGMAVGQPTFVTSVDYRNAFKGWSDFVADGNYAWEWWYKFQVTDNISVTPAIYYLSRPYGDLTDGRGAVVGGNRNNSTFNNFGGLLKTTFKF